MQQCNNGCWLCHRVGIAAAPQELFLESEKREEDEEKAMLTDERLTGTRHKMQEPDPPEPFPWSADE